MPVVGLEPTTLDLKGRYSTTELHEHGHSISWAVKRKSRAGGLELYVFWVYSPLLRNVKRGSNSYGHQSTCETQYLFRLDHAHENCTRPHRHGRDRGRGGYHGHRTQPTTPRAGWFNAI